MAMKNRTYTVTDDGDSYDLALFQDGVQIGGAMLPLEVLGDDEAHTLAVEIGELFQSSQGGYPRELVTALVKKAMR